MSAYLSFEINLASIAWLFEKNENEGKQNSWFLMEKMSIGKILVSLQIYIKDKLFDQKGWNFDTKNVNLHSLKHDQF